MKTNLISIVGHEHYAKQNSHIPMLGLPGLPPAPTLQKLIEDAPKGNAHAQCGLGAAFKEGNGVPQDDAKAIYWWRKPIAAIAWKRGG